MKADTARRPLLPMRQCVRMKCPRRRCQMALSSLLMAASMPSWAPDATSLTPRGHEDELAQERRSERQGFGGPDIQPLQSRPPATELAEGAQARTALPSFTITGATRPPVHLRSLSSSLPGQASTVEPQALVQPGQPVRPSGAKPHSVA
jgi:hypothetical protein